MNCEEAGKTMQALKESKEINRDNTHSSRSALEKEGVTLLLDQLLYQNGVLDHVCVGVYLFILTL